jgi:hypothetical protein
VRPTPRPDPGGARLTAPIGNNGLVNEYRWFNPHQPQTLQSAVFLCYLNAVFGILFGIAPTSLLMMLFIVAGLGAGGFGIANEKRWGYVLAVTAASLQVLVFVGFYGTEVISNISLLISFVFDVALLALLIHPMSRDYQRIWFK